MNHKYLARHPLGNSKREWKQDKFILSTFSPTCVYYNRNLQNPNAYDIARKAVKTCADAGFNLLEMGWATPEVTRAAIPMCESLGIDVIYQNMEIYGGMQERIGKEVKCDPEDIKNLVKDLSRYRHVIGYYVWDEPYMEPQLKEARRQMDMFEECDSSKLLFTVAIPSYNKVYTWKNGEFEGYLRRYVETLDPVVLSLDYYPISKKHTVEIQLDQTFMWYDLALMKKLAKEKNMPMWFYYQGQNLHGVEYFTFPMIRLMMNAGALYGAKGLQHYTAEGAVTKEGDGGPDIFCEDQKKIHAEFRELGNTLMALDCKRVIHDASMVAGNEYTVGLHETMADSELLSGELPYRTSISELEDEYGNKYLMVLNRDYETAKTVTLDLSDDFRIYEISKKDGYQHVVSDSAKQLSVDLIAGDMALFRLQRASEEAFTIEYVLEK